MARVRYLPRVQRLFCEHFAQQAAAWCDYLESHARRIYSMIISPARQAATELGRHLAAGWKRTEGMFTVRDVYRNEWSDLTTPEAVRRVLPMLEDAGWVRLAEMQCRKEGRPSEIYLVNPMVGRRAKVGRRSRDHIRIASRGCRD
jgi:hypothetical protein